MSFVYHLQKKSLAYDVWITLTGDNRKHRKPLRHKSFFQDGCMQERQIISIVSNGMKRLEQTMQLS